MRLYSQSDIEQLKAIQRMVQDMGLNLAGVEVILNMKEHMRRMENEMERLRQELQAYRDRTLPAVAGRGGE